MSISTIDKYLPDEPPTYSSDEIARVFFEGVQPMELTSSYINIVNESESFKTKDWRAAKEDYEDEFIFDKNTISTVTVTAKSPVKYRVFVSDDGDKLNYLINNSDTNGQPERNEIIIYIEGDKDSFSKQIMHVLAGNDVKLNEEAFNRVVRPYTELGTKDIENLLESAVKGEKSFQEQFLFLLEGIFKIKEIGFSLLSSAVGKSIKLVDKLKVSETVWNPKKERKKSTIETVFKGTKSLLDKTKAHLQKLDKRIFRRLERRKKLKNIIEKLGKAFDKLTDLIEIAINIFEKIVTTIVSLIRQQLALIIGVWNGLVDMISGLLFIVKVILDGGKLSAKAAVKSIEFTSNSEFQATLEQLDNILEYFRKIKVKEIFDSLIQNSRTLASSINFDQLGQSLKSSIKKGGKKVLSINTYQISYYIGYIATFFIPVGLIANLLGKAGKIGKLLGGTLKWVDDLMADVFKFSFNILKKAAKPLTAFLRVILKFLKGGAKAIKKSIDDLFEAFKRKLDEYFPGWRKPRIEEEVVKLYRVQGGILPNASRHRFVLNGKKLTIDGNERLYVTFKDEDRVLEFWIKRGETAEVFTADVNKSFFDKLMRDIVPQRRGKEFPNRPQYGDKSKTDYSIGIPSNYFDELKRNMSNIEILKFD